MDFTILLYVSLSDSIIAEYLPPPPNTLLFLNSLNSFLIN